MTPLELTPDHLQAIVPFIVVGFLAQLIDGAVARPFVTGYLVLAGLYLGWRAWRMRTDLPPRRAKVVAPLGAVLAKRVRPRVLLGAVSVVLVVTSVYGFASSLG